MLWRWSGSFTCFFEQCFDRHGWLSSSLKTKFCSTESVSTRKHSKLYWNVWSANWTSAGHRNQQNATGILYWCTGWNVHKTAKRRDELYTSVAVHSTTHTKSKGSFKDHLRITGRRVGFVKMESPLSTWFQRSMNLWRQSICQFVETLSVSVNLTQRSKTLAKRF